MGSIGIDATCLDDLSRKLTESAVKIRDEVDKTVWVVGAEVAEGAKELAGRHSKSIPPTIKMLPAPGKAVIRAGKPDEPLARLNEMGNQLKAKRGTRHGHIKMIGPVTAEQAATGQKTRAGFAHPVFGSSDTWVTQEAHPFIRPTFRAMRRQITKRMWAAWDSALEPLRR